MIQLILQWGVPTVLTALSTYIVKELNDNKKSNAAMKNSMIAILRSQIVSKCETYIAQGFLPDHARFCLEDLFTQYTLLGGNHGVGVLVDKCYQLPPIKKKKEKKKEA